MQVWFDNVPGVSEKHGPKRRSGCPVSISLEMLGDRWSLLIVRDLMVRGYRTFREFERSGEGIASNILADRLKKLEAAGILTAEAEETDGRKVNYRLTEKGIDLAAGVADLGSAARGDGSAVRRDGGDGEEPRGCSCGDSAAVEGTGSDAIAAKV